MQTSLISSQKALNLKVNGTPREQFELKMALPIDYFSLPKQLSKFDEQNLLRIKLGLEPKLKNG